ncbi:MAG: hypothetical protein NC093_07535 [Alistipes sp.]|nr:hypothetical protein [Alistipes sp.]
MFKSVEELIEELFEPVIYSRKNEELKDQAAAALEKEYTEQKNNGLTDIQAMGYVMNRYGSPDSVYSLGGESESVDGPEPMKIRQFKNLFRKIRMFSILTANYFTLAITSAFQGIVMKSPISIISVAIFMAIGTIFLLPFRKIQKKYSYENICLDKKQRTDFSSAVTDTRSVL